jgi:hypothetical protein
LGKFVKLLLVANLCLWVYFLEAFAQTSQRYDARPWGHPPVEPYSFWGHAVGLTISIFSYTFMKITYWVEIPSFAFVTVTMRILFGRLPSDQLVAGVSLPGYKLLAVMIISFLQWYLIGGMIQKLWQKRANKAAYVSRRVMDASA